MRAWQTIAQIFRRAEADLQREIVALRETMLQHPPHDPHIAMAQLAVIDAREGLARCARFLALDALIEAAMLAPPDLG